MKASNRRSLLPQPNSRPAELGTQSSSIAEAETRDSTRSAKRASVHLSRLERPLSRIGDPVASIGRPISRHAADEHININEAARPTSSSSIAPRRMPSVRTNTTTHTKSTSNGSVESNGKTHKSTTSREMKAPAAPHRLVRSGTLTRPSGPPSLDTKLPVSRAGISPVKTAFPKPATAGLTRTASVATRDDSAAQETSRVQTELFQLSLLHMQACAALASYDASAKRKLGERHGQLREMLREVIGLEQRRAKENNLDVLSRWLPDPADLIDTLQIVSSIYHETVSFSSDDSQFSNTMLSFQDWVLNAEECLRNEGIHQSITQLPEHWRHAHASTALSVRSLQRQLAQLPQPGQSSLATLMKTCSALLDATLRELDMMTKLETTLLELERQRIDNAISAYGCQDQLIPVPEVGVLSWQEVG